MSNLFLESLGEAEYDALRPYLEKVELPDRFVLHRGGETIEYCSLREEGVIEVATGAIGVRDLSRIVEYAMPMLDIDELATPEFVSGTPA